MRWSLRSRSIPTRCCRKSSWPRPIRSKSSRPTAGSSANKNLQGDALKAAVDKQNWDDSIKSLAATPDVLDMMSNKLDWTQQLGDAVLAQQPDVMDAIQRLRTKAQANNKLQSTSQQTVSTQQQGGRQYIYIAPTDPDEIYVPYYDPSVVYGAWPYPDYPPYYWPPPAYIGVGILATGLAFGTGYALGRWASGGNRWGGGFNWGGNNINANRSLNVNNFNGNNWTHNPAHRGNVGYSNPASRPNSAATPPRRWHQLNGRGSGGQQVLQPGGGNRGGAGAEQAREQAQAAIAPSATGPRAISRSAMPARPPGRPAARTRAAAAMPAPAAAAVQTSIAAVVAAAVPARPQRRRRRRWRRCRSRPWRRRRWRRRWCAWRRRRWRARAWRRRCRARWRRRRTPALIAGSCRWRMLEPIRPFPKTVQGSSSSGKGAACP